MTVSFFVTSDQRAQIADWLRERWPDVHQREADPLGPIGPDKPMGSLGIGVGVRGFLRLWSTTRELKRRELRFTVTPGAGWGWGDMNWWVYAWDPQALGTLLQEEERILSEAGWPTEPADFVARTREPAAPMTPLYRVIADAYGDKLNPGRPDVLPGVPREAIFDAWHLTTPFGLPEPAEIYFRIAERDAGGG